MKNKTKSNVVTMVKPEETEVKNQAVDSGKNKAENNELTSYQQLYKKLDDENFAREFYKRKLERAKDIIGDILSVMTGWSVVTESGNEWGHRGLLELLDMFMIRHDNFSRNQLAEDLQSHLFEWSMDYTDSYLKWQKKAFAARGLDEHGVEIEEQPEVLDSPQINEMTDIAIVEQPIPKTLEEHHLQITANKISHVLQSDKVSDNAKEALQSIICEAANEKGIGIDNPSLIKLSLPLIVNSLSPQYSRGVVDSLRSLLDSSLVDPIEEELRQYEKRFEFPEEVVGKPNQTKQKLAA